MRAPTLVLVLAVGASGCTTGWQRRGVEMPLDVPESFTGADASADTTAVAVSETWWTAFGSAELDEAVASTLAGNLGLQAAAARVRQARTAERTARSGHLPYVEAGLSGGRQRTLAPAPIGATQSNTVSLSLSASYEIDAWGRVAAGREAAALDAAALEHDAASIGITLTSQAVEAWLDGVHARSRRALLDHQIETQTQLLELLLLRLGNATASAVDVEQQRQQIQALRAQRALLDASEDTAGNRLSVLQGRMPDPDATGVTAALPALPDAPDVGIPADLLERRPDVAAARLRAHAADARLAQAIGARLPSLRISGSVFTQATSFADLFDEILWNLLGSVTAPLFEGGRRSAEIDRTDAVLDERILAYAETLVTAAAEVENAMALERAQRAYIAELEERLRTARRTLDLAQDQYREGVVDYLRILSVMTPLQQAEQSLLDARRQLLAYRVQLYRALGGGWSQPAVSE